MANKYLEWRERFQRAVQRPAGEIDLFEAALVIATDEYPDLDLAAYQNRVDVMAAAVQPHLPADRDPLRCVEVLNLYLFNSLGFKGNRDSYYDPRNSYLNDVLDRKLGLPITLAVVYLALGARLGLPLFGVGLPGHFVVKWKDADRQIVIDPFNGGEIMTDRRIEMVVRDTYQARAQIIPERLDAVDARYILIRMLNNLKLVFIQSDNYMRAWQVVDKLLILDRRSPENIRDMGLLSLRVGAYRQAATFLEEYLLTHADSDDADLIRNYMRTALEAVERLN